MLSELLLAVGPTFELDIVGIIIVMALGIIIWEYIEMGGLGGGF